MTLQEPVHHNSGWRETTNLPADGALGGKIYIQKMEAELTVPCPSRWSEVAQQPKVQGLPQQITSMCANTGTESERQSYQTQQNSIDFLRQCVPGTLHDVIFTVVSLLFSC